MLLISRISLSCYSMKTLIIARSWPQCILQYSAWLAWKKSIVIFLNQLCISHTINQPATNAYSQTSQIVNWTSMYIIIWFNKRKGLFLWSKGMIKIQEPTPQRKARCWNFSNFLEDSYMLKDYTRQNDIQNINVKILLMSLWFLNIVKLP